MQTTATISYVAALLAGSFAFGKGIDDVAKSEVKSEVVKWLNRIDLSADASGHIHQLLLSTFNNVFSESMFSKKFLWRSAQFSVLSSLVITVTVYFFMHAISKGDSPLVQLLESPIGIILAIIFLLGSAIFCDYLSLAKSSLIINTSSFRSAPFRHYMFDLLITILMSATWILLLAIAMAAFGANTMIDKQPNHVGKLIVFGLFSGVTMLAPTLVTLSFMLALYFARLSIFVGRPLQLLKISFLDIDSKPFTSIAILSWPPLILFALLTIWFVG
jgi:hypothetical protein